MCNVCPIIAGKSCAIVYKCSVLMEKCLYKICLLEQAFSSRVLGKPCSGMFSVGNKFDRKNR